MGINITLSRIKLVRESSHRYGNIESRHIDGPEDAVRIINAVLDLEHEAQEIFGELFLDAKNNLVGIMEVSRGSLTASIAHPREVFKAALLANCANVIIFHGHPSSGDPKPSSEDIHISKIMKRAGEILGVPLLDHIIIGDGRYTSMKETDQM